MALPKNGAYSRASLLHISSMDDLMPSNGFSFLLLAALLLGVVLLLQWVWRRPFFSGEGVRGNDGRAYDFPVLCNHSYPNQQVD